MQYHEFVGQVQHRARLGTTGEAVTAIRATLETLGERLAGGEAGHLAAQLPREVGIYLRQATAAPGEDLSLQDFFRRVSFREGVDLPDAVYHARAVIEVLSEAVTPGEMRDVLAQLPAEFDTLFAAGSSGRMPADDE